MIAGTLTLAAVRAAEPEWTVLIANDTCPDYTWGDDEATTRTSFAELVRSHLDEMTRTDSQAPENRDHYTMVTHEALWFLDRYPEREEELMRRVREGRMMLSPNLCNTLWGFQSAENAIRNMYPARRLQRKWDIPIDVMHHIEYPGLPWGISTLLAGSGVRWLSIAYLDIDAKFRKLQTPPVFHYDGPDGSRIGVVMDTWASGHWGYTQGSTLLKRPELVAGLWIPNFRGMGASYPARTMLASGTHGDTHPSSAGQTVGFAQGIIRQNAAPDRTARWVNGTYAQFCRIMDATEQQTPFMPVVRGSFGDSWDAWAVSLARSAADMRQNERDFLGAESLIALASLRRPELVDTTRARRERAEWCWLMLADHAWNGTDLANKIENARLRREWNEELQSLTAQLWRDGWTALGLTPRDGSRTIFNSLGSRRSGLVRVACADDHHIVHAGDQVLPTQVVTEDSERHLYCVTPPVEGFGFLHLETAAGKPSETSNALVAAPFELESPFYRLKVDPQNGGVSSLVFKATGSELVAPGAKRSLGQTIFTDDRDHLLENVSSRIEAVGPVLARLRIEGETAGIKVTTFITVYAELDRVDFDVRVHKPVSIQQQALVQAFPVMQPGATLRVETTAAVVRSGEQPDGDFLPGANFRRCAVQGFVESEAPGTPGVTIAPLDAFLLRRDLGQVTFEAVGNDQNHQEVLWNQARVVDFRFRYSLRAHTGDYDNAAALAWSREVATPLQVATGAVESLPEPPLEIDARRAIALCLKPVDDPAEHGVIVRVWETAGSSDPLPVAVRGLRSAMQTDFLERDLGELSISDGVVALPLRARGFGCIRLSR